MYATDLSPDEHAYARARLTAMGAQLAESAALRTTAWRDVFERTLRNPYVPAYYPALDQPAVLCVGDQRRAWLETVYSDQTLVTKVVHVPMSRAFGPATTPVYTSSSTLPSLVLRMLESLDVHDEHQVLEVGTGTGYTCALLCERLGSHRVSSVDLDPELIDLARERLSANGHTPTLAAMNGAHAAGGPYDRLIATCAVPDIPPAWLEQMTADGIILADLRRRLGGNLIRLTMTDGAAVGRFEPYAASFMWMRSTHRADVTGPTPIMAAIREHAISGTTSVDPALLLTDHLFGFVAQWQMPDVNRRIGSVDGHSVLYLDAPDGSTAEVHDHTAPHRRWPVIQAGPQRLWDHVEKVHQFWTDNEQPGYERFGVTATPTSQHVWLDDPHGPHQWALPRSRFF